MQSNIQAVFMSTNNVSNYESELGSLKITMIERAHGGHGEHRDFARGGRRRLTPGAEREEIFTRAESVERWSPEGRAAYAAGESSAARVCFDRCKVLHSGGERTYQRGKGID